MTKPLFPDINYLCHWLKVYAITAFVVAAAFMLAATVLWLVR